MPQTLPPSTGSTSPDPNRTFDDGPDTLPGATPPLNWLHFLIVIPFIYGLFSLGAWSQNHSPLPPPTGPYKSTPSVSSTTIVVHVTGAVHQPGVYKLPPQSRVEDAITKAGGALPDSDLNTLNLASWVEDGSRVEVPFKAGAVTPQVNTQAVTPQAPPETTQQPNTIPVAPAPTLNNTPPLTTQAPDASHATTNSPNQKININRADLGELNALPGVGPVTAQKILDYRTTNGPFSSVDDLDNVSGIGAKKLEQIRPFATVN